MRRVCARRGANLAGGGGSWCGEGESGNRSSGAGWEHHQIVLRSWLHEKDKTKGGGRVDESVQHRSLDDISEKKTSCREKDDDDAQAESPSASNPRSTRRSGLRWR